MKIYAPKSINKLLKFMLNNYHPICIKGAGYSHGGHTLLDNGIQIDMKNINHIITHDNNTVTVGSGCKWHDLIVFYQNIIQIVVSQLCNHIIIFQ